MANQDIIILWGSETGTAEHLAGVAEQRLKENGFSARVLDMAGVKLEQLSGFAHLLIITSTWGDGDPPTNAWDLLGALQAGTIDLGGVAYSVCALGDTAYYQFCKCGHDFDEALEKLGAKRFYPLQECDLDYEAPFEQWLQGVMQALNVSQNANTPVPG